MGQNDILIQIDMKDTFWDMLKTVLVGLVVGALAILALALAATGIGAIATGIMAALAVGGTVSVTIGTGAAILATAAGVWSAVTYYNTQLPTNVVLPVYSISPEEIFQGKILLFDVDFFNPVEEILEKHDENGNLEYYYYEEDGEEIPTSKQNTALDLQKIVSQWYMALRNIAIVLSMSVLLYIGIRMLLSSVAQDKAKYKQMLIDWVVGLCLLFFMHYIMAFSVSMVKQFTKLIVYNEEHELEDVQSYAGAIELDEDGKIREKVEDMGQEDAIQAAQKVDEDGNTVDTEFLVWPTNIMGQLRIASQMSYGDTGYIGYTLSYFILVLLTVYFIFVYLKRVLYMAFLTMIAPLVALTYPIDKINDGQAQGFDRWLKEYIFNLLIQPLHLILYTVLVSSAFELASTNSIYAIVAIAFLIPAEKLMRNLFGFEKASTPPSLAGAAVGAGLLNTGLQTLLHRTPPGKAGKNGSNGSDGDDSGAPTRIGYNNHNFDPLDDMAANIDDNDTPPAIDAGGASAADATAYNDQEDPVKRMEREALEEKIADGQITKDELTADQRRLLRLDNDEDNNGQDNDSESTSGSTSAATTAPARQIRTARNMSGKMTMGDRFRGAGRVLKDSGRQQIKGFKKGVKKGFRMAPGVIGGAMIGGTAAAFGASLGLATGDPSKALSYGSAAAVAGATFGGKTFTIQERTGEQSAAQIARDRAYYGDRYDDHVAEKNMKTWKKDSDKREELEKYLGADRAKQLYESGDIDNYLKHDITDTKMIAAMENVMKDHSDVKFNDVLAFKEAHDIYGNGTKRMGSKSRKELMDDYTGQFKQRNLSDKRANAGAEKIANGVDLLSSALGNV